MNGNAFPSPVTPPLSASAWLGRLDRNNPVLRGIYGPDAKLREQRIAQVRCVLQCFIERFGDQPVRIVRAPGRVNLRGMHVDTHGGWLNLMTHQREIVVVFAESGDGNMDVLNVDSAFAPVHLDVHNLASALPCKTSWDDFAAGPVAAHFRARARGDWANYVTGAVARVLYAGRAGDSARGMQAAVAGDIPRGAALSSSHALSVAMLLACAACQRQVFNTDELILAARDVEWFAGARTGTADQAAIVLGRPGKIVRAALLAEDFSTQSVTWHEFPEALDLLVVQSHTTRNLSGEHKRAYTQNRFAYSVALDVFRQTLVREGHTTSEVEKLDRLSRITPESVGGLEALYRIIGQIPEFIPLNHLRDTYHLPHFDEAFTRYFGGFPEHELPANIPLRGPLLFGIAESERARAFAPLLEAGRYREAGRLMSIGHDGDRVRAPDGTPFRVDLSDAALNEHAAAGTPLDECPGAYGASSPVLDWLVDAALRAGALSACLTGAGIAGSVIALCEKEESAHIADALRKILGAEDYAARAGLPAPLTEAMVGGSVVSNISIAGAGYLARINY